MRLRFLGAATTVTGSQFLLTTDRARVIVGDQYRTVFEHEQVDRATQYFVPTLEADDEGFVGNRSIAVELHAHDPIAALLAAIPGAVLGDE